LSRGFNKALIISDMNEFFSYSHFRLQYKRSIVVMYYFVVNRIYRYLAVYLSDVVIAISTRIEHRLQLPKHRVLVIPAMVSDSTFKTTPSNFSIEGAVDAMRSDVASLSTLRLFYSGGFKHVDAIQSFLGGLKMAFDQRLNYSLCIASFLPKKEIIRCLALSGLCFETYADRIEIHSRIDHEGYNRLLAASSFLLLPRAVDENSLMSFPTRLCQYLQSGTPVVTANMPDINRYLVPMRHFFSCDFSTPESFYAFLVKLLSYDQHCISEVTKLGLSRAKRIFSSNFHSKRLLRHLHRRAQKLSATP